MKNFVQKMKGKCTSFKYTIILILISTTGLYAQTDNPSVTFTALSEVQYDGGAGNEYYGFSIAAQVHGSNCDIEKVEFYRDSIKVAQLSDDFWGTYQIYTNLHIGVNYVSVKAVDRCGRTISSVTRPVIATTFSSKFYKAVNLNGPTMSVDGIEYTSSTSTPGFSYQAKAFANQSVKLVPSADNERANLIRSSLYSTATIPAKFTFSDVPSGRYELYAYVWEDNNAQTFTLKVNGQQATKINSGSKGNWAKRGPFIVSLNAPDKIEITAEGGDANISAIEIWKVNEEDFYRAINLNGPSLKIDNLQFESSASAPDFTSEARAFSNQSIVLNPQTDATRAQMIRSSLYSTKTTPAHFIFKNVPIEVARYDNGEYVDFNSAYEMFFYVWEDNYPQDFYVEVQQGRETIDPRPYFNSGSKGEWKLIGPIFLDARTIDWNYNDGTHTSASGDLEIEIGGGDANISGIELWKFGHLVRWFPTSASPALTIAKASKKTSVYPNPLGQNLTVELPDAYKGKLSVTITDATGKMYLQTAQNLNGKKQLTLEIPNSANMKQGLYFLKLNYGDKVEVIRLNKE